MLDLGFARPGLDALCRVLEAWVQHFTGAGVSIQPVQKITDEYIGRVDQTFAKKEQDILG